MQSRPTVDTCHQGENCTMESSNSNGSEGGAEWVMVKKCQTSSAEIQEAEFEMAMSRERQKKELIHLKSLKTIYINIPYSHIVISFDCLISGCFYLSQDESDKIQLEATHESFVSIL